MRLDNITMQDELHVLSFRTEKGFYLPGMGGLPTYLPGMFEIYTNLIVTEKTHSINFLEKSPPLSF